MDRENQIKQKFNQVWNSRGKTLRVQNQERTITDVRLTYGGNMSLSLNKPLEGKTSNLFTVSPDNIFFITIK